MSDATVESRRKTLEKSSGDATPAVAGLLRIPPGPVDLAAFDPRTTPGLDGGKAAAAADLDRLGTRLADLQERLFATGRRGGERRVLLVLQGMDTSGKGGTLRHVVGLVDPQGVRIKGFKAPTPQERRRGFLWRVRRALPQPGEIGAFDRSHYEDVIVTRVRKLFPAHVIERRYDEINRFEKELAESECEVVKVMLHISFEEQRERLLARIADPSKHWKYNPGDVDERMLWPEYQRAYEIALERCNTGWAPWHVVPADRKWYRNWAVAHLLAERLEAMGLEWPRTTFDPEVERGRLEATGAAFTPLRSGGPTR
jgi:PPK2 family polyphosphate:nucleotide phosphotransferase